MRRLCPNPEIEAARLKAEFGRFLAAWAQDCLRVGKNGLDRPGDRDGCGMVGIGMGLAAELGKVRLKRPADDLSMIEWRPWVEAGSPGA
jgi:hypothetical protein